MAPHLFLQELKFANTLQKGQLVTLEAVLRYREVEDEVNGAPLKHWFAKTHTVNMKWL